MKQSKTSGLMSLVENIQDLIVEMNSIENCDNSVIFNEERQWLNSQLVCLLRRVKREILVVNGSTEPKVIIIKKFLYFI